MSLLPTNTGAGAPPVLGGASGSSPLPPDPLVGKPVGREENIANWAGPYVTDMLGKAQALSNMPYQTYGGPLTAGPSDLQQKFFGGLGSLGFPSTLGQSFTGTTTGADGQPTSVAQQYMNPYMAQVLAPQLQAMQRQSDIQRNLIGAKTAQQGAFGGARSGIMESQLNAELMRQQQEATGKAYGEAFNRGMEQFNVEQSRARQLADMLGTAGTQQRQIEQEGITADLNEFLQQRDYPIKQVQFLQSMLQGLPVAAASTTYQQPSGLSNVLGNTSGILSLLRQLNVIPNTTGTTTGTTR
jgi:hypothetical protein